MTERVDLDRLADFVGGALDDTPDAAAVRHLIDTDPEWAAAHDELAGAMNLVTADLRAVGSRPEPVPEAVAARLDELLRPLAVESAARAATAPPGPRGDGGRPNAGRPASERPAGGPVNARPGGAGPGRQARTRRARMVAGLSAVAAVIAVGIGLIALVPQFSPGGGNDAASVGDAAEAPAAAPYATPARGRPNVSGRDYRPGDFAGLDPADDTLHGRPDNEAAPGSRATTGGKSGAEPPAEIARFTDDATLQRCIDAIVGAFGGRVRTIDLARFTGRPAVVVLLDGARAATARQGWVVVAGPGCGTTGATDELYNGPVA
jgi:hypothetical protein